MSRKIDKNIYAKYDYPDESDYDEDEFSEYDDDDFDDDDFDDEPEEPVKPRTRKKKKKSHKFRNIFLLALAALIITFFATGLAKKAFNRLFSHVAKDYIVGNMKSFTEEDSEVRLTYNFAIPDSIPEGYVYDKDIINVLLVGVEGMNTGEAYTGRSDTMILASVNTLTGDIKLASFLRDTYVEIEGHDASKLNAAYAFGSMDLLVDTISKTYKIYINSVCLVNFDDFQEVIDTLGGVDVEISELEAEYLNTTNYISDKANRTLVAGVNHLNGNQALGYARVRKVEKEYEGKTYYNDFGRTIRQRELLKSIYQAYKDYPKTKILSVTKEILGKVMSNLTEEQVEYLLNAYLDHPGKEIQTMQVPVKGYYEGATKDCGECIVMDVDANIALLHHFLYGTELPEGISEDTE